MSIDTLSSPIYHDRSEALLISQQAPAFLRSQSSWPIPWPLSLFITSDDAEKWTTYENLFYSCLRTGDDKSAYACLEKLKQRFGEKNERVMGLIGLYHEATRTDLGVVLGSYDLAIADTPTNMVIRKRRAALLRSQSKLPEATVALVELLEISPTDAEAWAELADLYYTQGLYQQAIFSLEEVLTVTPNAWNVHARLGEMTYISAILTQSTDLALVKGLSRSIKSFCRGIELCDDYLRGYYGLKLATSKLREIELKPNALKEIANDDELLISKAIAEKLNLLATSKLSEIIRKHSSREAGWAGYKESEVIAARALLDRDNKAITR